MALHDARSSSPPRAAKRAHKARWRESIEGITVAIVMAVFLKYFIVEAYKIPSGSMQPTLMGSPETGIFDRILVDKLSYHVRDPERFEVVVFRHPLNRSLNMIKRLVGLPGESLRIQYGDLWARPTGAEEWRVLRRPDSVQKEMWRALETEWRPTEGTAGWTVEGDTVAAGGAGAATFPAPGLSIQNDYTDGYPARMAADIRHRPRLAGTKAVGDLRLAGQVAPSATCREIAIELEEGPQRYRFTLPGPAAEAGQVAAIAVHGESSAGAASSQGPLEAGRRVGFAVQNLDDELRLELDGEVIVRLEVQGSANQRSRITLSTAAGGAEFSELEAFRDIYYVDDGMRQRFWNDIPEGHYVVLGDNTLDSADARDWGVARLRVPGPEGPVILEGNSRRSNRPDDANPYTSRGTLFFRDSWGEVRAFPSDDVEELGDAPGPTVPRSLITGRAVCVFWPLSWRYRVLRPTWIH